jgi:hypothetical protein
MRVLSLGMVAGLVVLAAASVGTVSHRKGGLRTVGAAEPLLVNAQQVDTSMAAADAAAANAFLGGGIEPADLRTQYQRAIADASAHLTRASGQVTSASANAADVLTLTQQLPVYTGLIETARANNRQGFPVGAAYLRQANHLLADTILPATQHLYQRATARLDSGRQSASSSTDLFLLELCAVLALVTTIAGQLWLRQRTNRLFNPRLVVAALLTLGVVVVTTVSLQQEATAVSRAHNRGSAVIDLVAQSRIAAFKAKGDESLTLVARGNGSSYEDDYKAQMATLTTVLTQAGDRAADAPTQTAVSNAVAAVPAYLAVHRRIRTLDDGGQFQQAVKLAVGTGAGSANAAFESMDAPLRSALASGQVQFDHHLKVANDNLARLTVLVVLALVLAGLLALFGIQQRINEYR